MPALPSIRTLCLNAPLYTTFDIDESDSDQLRLMIVNDIKFDAHCIGCADNSIFEFTGSRGGGAGMPTPDYTANRVFDVDLGCARDRSHRLLFIFQLVDKRLQKIGQYPSIADLNTAEYKKYIRALDEKTMKEFNRAVGLAAHGIGIGSFVYFRRVFERLVNENLQKAKAAGEHINEEEFKRLRMDEKIDRLRGQLPIVVVENRAIYAILSKGIHELNEDECLEIFPVVRGAIVLILEQEVARREEKRIAAEIQKNINTIKAKLT